MPVPLGERTLIKAGIDLEKDCPKAPLHQRQDLGARKYRYYQALRRSACRDGQNWCVFHCAMGGNGGRRGSAEVVRCKRDAR